VREQVRWIERVCATQIKHRATRNVWKGFDNGGVMPDVEG
jgi:hypothetical protein